MTARVAYMTKGGEWRLNPPLCVMGLEVLARAKREDSASETRVDNRILTNDKKH